MPAEPPDDEVLSLDEVFDEEEPVRLLLTAEEWEIIIALAEAGGSGSIHELARATRMELDAVREIVKSLHRRGILAQSAGAKPESSGEAEPDLEAARYLDEIREKNHYQILGLDPDVDQAEVRRAYFRLMRKYHPDRFMTEKNPESREHLKEIFRTLTRAYETLADPDSRSEYDLAIPEFTGAAEKEEDEVLGAMLETEQAPEPLPTANPEMAKSFYDSAIDDFQQERYESAELNFRLAASLDPSREDYRAGLNKAHKIVGKEKAGKAAEKALLLEHEGKLQTAIRTMARAAAMDPEQPKYCFELARMMLEHGGDLHKARMQIQMALDREPGNIEHLMLFARIQEALGEIQDATHTYKKILSLDFDNERALENLKRLKKKEN